MLNVVWNYGTRNPLDNFQPSVIYMRCNWFDTQPAAARNFPDRYKEREKERKKTSRLVMTRVLTFYFLDTDTITVLI